MRKTSIFKPDPNLEGVTPQDILTECVEARHIGRGEVLETKLDNYPLAGEFFTHDNGVSVPKLVTPNQYYPVTDLQQGANLGASCLCCNCGLGIFSLEGTILEDDFADGYYIVSLNCSFEADKVSIVKGAIFKNDEILDKLNFSSKIAVITDRISPSMSGIIQLQKDDEINFRMASGTANTSIHIIDLNFKLYRFRKRD